VAPPATAEPAPSGSGASHSTSQNAPPATQAPRRLLKIKRSTPALSLPAGPVPQAPPAPPPQQPLQLHAPGKPKKLKLRKISHPSSDTNNKLTNGTTTPAAPPRPTNGIVGHGPKKRALKPSKQSAPSAQPVPNYNQINSLLNASSMLTSSLTPGLKPPLKLKGHVPGSKVSVKLRAHPPITPTTFNAQGPSTTPPRKIIRIKKHSVLPAPALPQTLAAGPPADSAARAQLPKQHRLVTPSKGRLLGHGLRKGGVVGEKRSAALVKLSRGGTPIKRIKVCS
jgi:hypothetical protein